MVKPEVSDINPRFSPKFSDTRGFGLNPTNFKGLDAKGIYIYIFAIDIQDIEDIQIGLKSYDANLSMHI